MIVKRRLPNAVVTALRTHRMIAIRAGSGAHRFIKIWAVVVEGRVFMRSWSLEPRSWWRRFLEDPRGAIEVAGHKLPVRAVQTRSERLKDAVSRAYLAKYGSGSGLKYARDLNRARSRATTTEVLPRQLNARTARRPARGS